MKDKNIRPLYFADEIFYWARIGKQPTVLEIQCTLAEKADPEVLESAFLSALKVHTNFRIRPVIVNSKFMAKVEDAEKAPVYKKDGKVRQLATSETEGLLLYIVYEENEITLHIFHGLSDFRGILAFINTMLKFYYSEKGEIECSLPEPDSADTLPSYENIIAKGAPGEPIGLFIPEEDKVFHLPEEYFGKRTTKQHICEIDVPLDPILALSRGSESSVIPAIQAFIGHAIRKTYDVGDKDIIGYTPVDLRPIFDIETSGNASSNFPIRYSEALDRHELGERAMMLRSFLDLQIQPENLYARIKGNMEKVKPVVEAPLPLDIQTHLIVDGGRKIDRASYTYGISYAGKVCFDEEIRKHITSVTGCAASYSYPVWIVAAETNGIIRMVFTQNYDSVTLVKNICRELSEEIPETCFKDWGHHEFDEFHLYKIKRIYRKKESENV